MGAAISYIQSPLPPDAYHAPREIEHPLFSFGDVEAETLVWIQPQWMRPAYELWAEERVVATLRFKGLSSSPALAASAEGLWMFERHALLDVVEIQQSGKHIATLSERDAVSYTLEYENGGRSFVWTREGLFGRRWAFVDAIGNPLLFFVPESSPQARLRVQIPPGAAHLPQLTFLALLGKFLMLARRNDDLLNGMGSAGGWWI